MSNEMILHIWRDGALAIDHTLPTGAIELARGPEAALHSALARIAGAASSTPRLRGLADVADTNAARDLLRSHMAMLAAEAHANGITLNHAVDLRFVGQG